MKIRQGLKGVVTGGQVIASRAMENIIFDMGSSLGLAAIFISIFTLIMFRSFRLTLVALFPNMLPIIVSLAFMASFISHPCFYRRYFCMALGVTGGHCIHLLARLREEMDAVPDKESADADAVLYRTITGTGRPIVYTTLLFTHRIFGDGVFGVSFTEKLRHALVYYFGHGAGGGYCTFPCHGAHVDIKPR